MKNNNKKKLGVLVAIVVACLYGCEQPHDDEMVPIAEDGPPVQLINGTLKFATAQHYENYFDDAESFDIPEFTSMAKASANIGNPANERTSHEDQSYMEEWEDALILDLLDEDGMIIIEENLIFLDFENRIAAVTEDHSLRADILNGNYDDNRISVFSFEDDVLEIIGSEPDYIEQKSEETKENLRMMQNCPGTFPPGSTALPMNGHGCDDRKCELTQIYPGNPGGHDYRAIMTHVYQAAAIYFRLKSELTFHRRSHPNGSWSAYPTDMNITYWGSFTPRNRATVHLSGCYDQCQGCSPPPANRQKVQKIHHEAGRRLTQYNLYGIYQYYSYNLGTLAIQLYNIQRN